MSRLDSSIRRMTAQRAVLNQIAEKLVDIPGPIFEFGFGSGRTYDHMRELWPERRIVIFECAAHIVPSIPAAAADVMVGDIRETAIRLPGACAALVHADIETGDSRINSGLAAWFPGYDRPSSRTRRVWRQRLCPARSPSQARTAPAGSRTRTLPCCSTALTGDRSASMVARVADRIAMLVRSRIMGPSRQRGILARRSDRTACGYRDRCRQVEDEHLARRVCPAVEPGLRRVPSGALASREVPLGVAAPSRASLERRSMRFLGVGETCDLGALYLALQAEGHEVRVAVSEPEAQGTLAGLCRATPDWRGELDWVRAGTEPGIILFESVSEGFGSLQDALRRDGFNVIGGSAYGDRLENDRAYAQGCSPNWVSRPGTSGSSRKPRSVAFIASGRPATS